MMQDLQKKITEEGKEEQNTFRKFTVFCTDTEAEKAEVIQTNSDAKATLEANIATYEADKVKLNATIDEALAQIQATEAKIGADAVARQQEKDAHFKSLKETHDAIHSLDAAVESLKVTKPQDVSFIQQTVKALSSKLHSKELLQRIMTSTLVTSFPLSRASNLSSEQQSLMPKKQKQRLK